ncbi:30S ribosomal protein S7 [Candidatus Pacearchaeota archaeon]|nr:30S ribosomal protein S7 [Candidatus Pacearchaeota archaeon]
MKLFDMSDTSEIKVDDPGLKGYISIEPRLLAKSHGRMRARFSKSKMNVVERFITHLGIPGHRGKKHKVMTSHASGKYNKNAKIMIETMKEIERKTGKNPVQVIIKAIEHSAPRDGVTVIEYGGARYPQAVDLSPSRRVDLAIRLLIHGAYDKAFNKKANIIQGLVSEIVAASQNLPESLAVQKKNESEKQADSAR